MEKKMKLAEVLALGTFLATTEDVMDGMKLNAKALYGVLKLKKAILEKFATAQETVMALAKNYDAVPTEPTPDGQQGVKVPDEKLPEFNKDYAELLSEEVTIVYDTIEISASADCSPKFMEAFLDFIEITN